PVTTSAVRLAGIDKPIFRIPCAISTPVIAPGSTHMAFSLTGEVLPLTPTFCDVCVIDMRGTPLVGDLRAALTGDVVSRYTVSNLAWNGAGELRVTGSKVDVFGGETSFSKSLPVPIPMKKYQ